MNKMKTALNNLDRDVLEDGFCLLYDELKKGGSVEEAPLQTVQEPQIPNFTSLILHLKDKYPFEELKDFIVEGGRVIWKRGGRRIDLSREEQEIVRTPPPSKTETQEEAAPRFRQLEMN